jgi:hypothetical protein
MNRVFESMLSRRDVLLGGAAVGAGVLVPVASVTAHTTSARERISVLLHDRRIAPQSSLLARWQTRGAHIVMLGEDPVRQWRDASAVWLAQRDARLLGITRWPDFLMLRGLAAESRMHVRFASDVSADGVLTWLIA